VAPGHHQLFQLLPHPIVGRAGSNPQREQYLV
jgi:hypothetical protein